MDHLPMRTALFQVQRVGRLVELIFSDARNYLVGSNKEAGTSVLTTVPG